MVALPLLHLVDRHAVRGSRHPSPVPGRRPLSAWLTRLHQGSSAPGSLDRRTRSSSRTTTSARAFGKESISGPGRAPDLSRARVVSRFVVGNLHATNDFRRPEVPTAEVERASLRRVARGPTSRSSSRGDFNVHFAVAAQSAPGPGIDQILVRGAPVTSLEVWPVERRTVGGIVLSDHATVEARRMTIEEAGSVPGAGAHRLSERGDVRAARAANRRGDAGRAGARPRRRTCRQGVVRASGSPSERTLVSAWPRWSAPRRSRWLSTASTTDGCNLVIAGLGHERLLPGGRGSGTPAPGRKP